MFIRSRTHPVFGIMWVIRVKLIMMLGLQVRVQQGIAETHGATAGAGRAGQTEIDEGHARASISEDDRPRRPAEMSTKITHISSMTVKRRLTAWTARTAGGPVEDRLTSRWKQA